MAEDSADSVREQEKPKKVEEERIDVEKVTPPTKSKSSRPRNYSFLHKKTEHMDEVEVKGTTYTIPAYIGSTYWAILKVMYEHANKPVYHDQLPKLVEELMLDRDAAAWNSYKAKSQITVSRKADSDYKRVIQPAKPWQDRIIGNAKTLTRLGGNSQYGKRLYERGHVMRCEYDAKMKPYFILHTSLDCLKKQEEATTDGE